ncbi:MAG: hypothetical protein K6E40_10055 [Desulfovibrio sp.]|nr:hypothetical protein [Desulfovibrio sp.]
MAKRHADLTGRRFGRLVVVQEAHPDRGYHPRWLCKCDCGNTKEIAHYNLLDGTTRSCGCLARDLLTVHGDALYKKRTRLYCVWIAIKQRCMNKNNKRYEMYGGRGIKLCDEWLHYANFKEWAINNGYRRGLSIDRIDNKGDYEPSNCRWVDVYTQQRNKSNNLRVIVDGKEMILTDAAKILGVQRQTMTYWYKHHGPEEAVARAKRFAEEHNADPK